MKIVAITQARMGSTRLPGKVLCDIIGEPMLVHHVNRVRRAKMIDDIVVATTTKEADNMIEALCIQKNWLCFRGSEEDVLDRYYKAAIVNDADAVVRITSDCPLIDPDVVDKTIQEFMKLQPNIDYVSNGFPVCTFPRGLDTEVMSFNALKNAWLQDNNSLWREHVTPYIIYNPQHFRLHGIINDPDLSNMRWTVDTPEDLTFVRCIFEHFGHDNFTWKEVLSVLDRNPKWLEINRHVKQKTVPSERH